VYGGNSDFGIDNPDYDFVAYADVWVLTNANGLGGTAALGAIASEGVPAGGPDQPYGSLRFRPPTGWVSSQGSVSRVHLFSTWVLSDANGPLRPAPFLDRVSAARRHESQLRIVHESLRRLFAAFTERRWRWGGPSEPRNPQRASTTGRRSAPARQTGRAAAHGWVRRWTDPHLRTLPRGRR